MPANGFKTFANCTFLNYYDFYIPHYLHLYLLTGVPKLSIRLITYYSPQVVSKQNGF